MRFFANFLSPSPYDSPRKLAAVSAVSFALAALVLTPALNLDYGMPVISALSKASGKLAYLDSDEGDLIFRLDQRGELFEYSSNAGVSGAVWTALESADEMEVAVLFAPDDPRTPRYSSEAHYTVWQISINGQVVRSFEQVKDGFRTNHLWARWICIVSLLSGVYYAVLAKKARWQRLSW